MGTVFFFILKWGEFFLFDFMFYIFLNFFLHD